MKENPKKFLEREGKLAPNVNKDKIDYYVFIDKSFLVALADGGMFCLIATSSSEYDFINNKYEAVWYTIQGKKILPFTNPDFERHLK